MNSADDEKQVDAVTTDDAVRDASACAQIEQRLQALFRFAGDSDQVKRLMQMVIRYRCGQLQ